MEAGLRRTRCWHIVVPLLATMVAFAHAQSASAPRMSEEVARLAAATTNEERFDAFVAILRANGLTFSVESFTIEKPIGREPRTEGRNIVVTVGDSADHIVIGAHYDAVRLPDGRLSQGAVDNAASSVLLARVARAVRAESLGARVSFVWFDMEELGLIGSRRYVQQHAADKPSAMINLDINAYGDTILFGPSQRAESQALRRTVVETCAGEDLPCVPFPQMPPGDDRSFVQEGIPTVSLAILPAVEAHRVWLIMNSGEKGQAAGSNAQPAILRTIHTAADTPDKINEETMATMLRFTTSLVGRLARRP